MSPITINGNGTVSGITAGGLISQVVTSTNTYTEAHTGTANTEYTINSASGTAWEPQITITQGNKVHISLTLYVGKSAGGDANAYFDVYYKVDSGSYTKVAAGASLGSRSQHFGNIRSYSGGYNIEESSAQAEITPSISGSTGVITFQVRLTQRAGSNRAMHVNHTETDNSEGGTTVSTFTAMEITT